METELVFENFEEFDKDTEIHLLGTTAKIKYPETYYIAIGIEDEKIKWQKIETTGYEKKSLPETPESSLSDDEVFKHAKDIISVFMPGKSLEEAMGDLLHNYACSCDEYCEDIGNAGPYYNYNIDRLGKENIKSVLQQWHDSLSEKGLLKGEDQ